MSPLSSGLQSTLGIANIFLRRDLKISYTGFSVTFISGVHFINHTMPYQRRAKIMNNHTFFFFKYTLQMEKISGIRLIYRMPMHFFNYYFRTTTIYTDPRRIWRIKPSPQRNPKKYPHAPPRQTDIGVRKAYSQQNYILNEIPH